MDIDLLMSLSLLDDARSLDVDIPNYEDAKMWFHDEIRGRVWLSTHGRSVVRKLIDEEKARRFEVRTRWITKVILPLAAAAIGIIGATTGLLAILHQKK